jgi:hypothetical protein
MATIGQNSGRASGDHLRLSAIVPMGESRAKALSGATSYKPHTFISCAWA